MFILFALSLCLLPNSSSAAGFGINLIEVHVGDPSQVICSMALLQKYFHSGYSLSGSVLYMSLTSASLHTQNNLLDAMHGIKELPWSVVIRDAKAAKLTNQHNTAVLHEKPQGYFVVIENLEDEDLEDIFEDWKTTINWNPLAQFVVYLASIEETDEEMTELMIEILLSFMNKKIYNVNVIGQNEESGYFYGKTVFPYHPDNNCGNRVISIEILDVCDYQGEIDDSSDQDDDDEEEEEEKEAEQDEAEEEEAEEDEAELGEDETKKGEDEDETKKEEYEDETKKGEDEDETKKEEYEDETKKEEYEDETKKGEDEDKTKKGEDADETEKGDDVDETKKEEYEDETKKEEYEDEAKKGEDEDETKKEEYEDETKKEENENGEGFQKKGVDALEKNGGGEREELDEEGNNKTDEANKDSDYNGKNDVGNDKDENDNEINEEHDKSTETEDGNNGDDSNGVANKNEENDQNFSNEGKDMQSISAQDKENDENDENQNINNLPVENNNGNAYGLSAEEDLQNESKLSKDSYDDDASNHDQFNESKNSSELKEERRNKSNGYGANKNQSKKSYKGGSHESPTKGSNEMNGDQHDYGSDQYDKRENSYDMLEVDTESKDKVVFKKNEDSTKNLNVKKYENSKSVALDKAHKKAQKNHDFDDENIKLLNNKRKKTLKFEARKKRSIEKTRKKRQETENDYGNDVAKNSSVDTVQASKPKLYTEEIYRALFFDKFPKDLSGCPLVAAYRPWEPFIFSETYDKQTEEGYGDDELLASSSENLTDNLEENQFDYGNSKPVVEVEEENSDKPFLDTAYDTSSSESESSELQGETELKAKLSGIEYQLLQIIAERLHISIDLQVEDRSLYHLFQQLIDGDVEMVIGGIDEDPSISQYVSTTIPYHQDDLTWCVAKARRSYDLFNFLASFSKLSWLLTIIFSFVAASCIAIMQKILKASAQKSFRSYFGISFRVIGIVFNQSVPLAAGLPNSIRLTLSATFLMGLFFMNAYQSFLISTLTTPKSAYQISRVDEIYQQRMKIMGSVENVRHLNKPGKVFKYIRENFEMCYNIEECLLRAAHDDKLAVAVSRQHSFYNPRIPRNRLYCFDRNENLYVYLVTMLLPKKFHLLHKINPVIQHVIESGHMQKWARDLDMRRVIREQRSHAHEDAFRSLTLGQVWGSFVFAAAILAFACLILVLERWVHRLATRRRRRTRIKIIKYLHKKFQQA